MKSNRRLDAAHQRGFDDGRAGKPGNPFQRDRFELWAYDSGRRMGLSEWERNAKRIAKFNQEAE